MNTAKEERVVCTLCRADAHFVDGLWRHKSAPWEDQSTLCDKYGYPIRVRWEPVPEGEK